MQKLYRAPYQSVTPVSYPDISAYLESQKKSQKPAAFFAKLIIAFHPIWLVKWRLRDAAGSDLGMQAIFELGVLSLIAFFTLVAIGHLGKIPKFPRGLQVLLLVYAIAAISSINSYWPALSVAKSAMYAISAICLSTAASILGAKESLRILYLSTIGMILAGIVLGVVLPDNYPLLRMLTSTPYAQDWRARLTVFEIHPGVLADIAAILTIVGLGIERSPFHYRVIGSFSICILTVSRGSAVALLTVTSAWLAIYFFRKIKRNGLYLLWLLSALLVIGVIAYIWVPWDSVLNSIQSITDRSLGDTTFNGRVKLWSIAADLLLPTTFIGYGFDGTRLLFLQMYGWAGNVHNGYLDLWLCLGGVGCVIYFWWLIKSLLTRGAVERWRGMGICLIVYILIESVLGGVIVGGQTAGVMVAVIMLNSAQTTKLGNNA